MVSHSFETVVVEAPRAARCCNTSCAPGCTTANRRKGFPGPTSGGAATTCSWEPVKDANVFLSSALLKNEPPMAGERRCRIFLHGDTAANPPQAPRLAAPPSTWLCENFRQQKASLRLSESLSITCTPPSPINPFTFTLQLLAAGYVTQPQRMPRREKCNASGQNVFFSKALMKY